MAEALAKAGTPARLVRIEIQQLDADGNVWRVFTLHKWPCEVDAALDRIGRAYNMGRTRVLMGGEVVL